MKNPYKIDGPAFISFSGGRTSGFMLWNILQAHGGTLPDDVIVSFQNTGKEMPETLDFIQECSERWDVPIIWLEHDFIDDEKNWFKVVNHNSASRNGEPFANLIKKYGACPNARNRFCTGIMKIQTMQKYARNALGWRDFDAIIGLRADEPRRVANINNNTPKYMENICPIAQAGHTSQDVYDFWKNQDFDLNLGVANNSTPLSNCDLCFLKGTKTLVRVIKENPSLADWWIEMEGDYIQYGGFENKRPLYRDLLAMALSQGDMFDDLPDDETIPCTCTD